MVLHQLVVNAEHRPALGLHVLQQNVYRINSLLFYWVVEKVQQQILVLLHDHLKYVLAERLEVVRRRAYACYSVSRIGV